MIISYIKQKFFLSVKLFSDKPSLTEDLQFKSKIKYFYAEVKFGRKANP